MRSLITTLFAIAAVLCVTPSTNAKIGETVQQIEARYGPALTSETDSYCVRNKYKFEEFGVAVEFIRGISAMESVRYFNDGRSLEKTQCLTLLKALTGRDDWKDEPADFQTMAWHGGGDFSASLSRKITGDVLTVGTKEWARLQKEKIQNDLFRLAERFGGAPDSTNKTAVVAATRPLSPEAQALKAKIAAEKPLASARLLKYQTEKAEAGDSFYQYQLAVRYRDGDGVAADLPHARELFAASAKSGYVDAQTALDALPK